MVSFHDDSKPTPKGPDGTYYHAALMLRISILIIHLCCYLVRYDV